MASLLRRCPSVEHAVNALNHAMIENIPETKLRRAGLLPVTSDVHLASKKVDEDKRAAFSPVTAIELKELEKKIAERLSAVFSALDGQYLFFRIAEDGSLVGHTTPLGLAAYPGEDVSSGCYAM